MTGYERHEKSDDRPRNGGNRGPRRNNGYRGDRKYDGKFSDNGKKEFKPRNFKGGNRGGSYGNDRSGPRRSDRDHHPRNDGSDEHGTGTGRDRKFDRPKRNGGAFKPRSDRRSGSGYGERDRPRRSREDRDTESDVTQDRRQEQKLTIPSTPQRILFKGVDCEINGRSDLAIILYLHGAAMMSKGCENNATKMLREMGFGEFRTVRGRISEMCSDDAMIEYDYICWTLDKGYNRSLVDSAADDGNPFAIYCLIRLGEIEGEDDRIDAFVTASEKSPQMVEDGLKLLKRRKDSVKAASYLEKNEERKKLRGSIRNTFVKAKKGDRGSAKRLEELGELFPEARFLVGFLDASENGKAEDYLKNGYGEFSETILSMEPELGISDTVFGMFIKAKRLQRNEEEWIPLMINAAKAGSPEAMEELKPIQNRKDVRKSFSSIYLANGDVENLVRSFDGIDTYWLDQYCNGDMDKIAEIGTVMGGAREIDWLKKNYRDGVEGCRSALIEMADREDRQCKQLVYALHDVGADVSAAKLYFEMFGDPTLPSVKWLGKVCEDEAAKEYVRGQFESMGDLATFDSIFVDDGYSRGKPRGGGRSGGYGNRNNRRRY